MIEGTRSYRRKEEAKISSSPAAPGGEKSIDDKDGTNHPIELASKSSGESSGSTAANDAAEAARREGGLDRRAWFSSLVPALGDGLVKILRASNNLKDDLGLRR